MPAAAREVTTARFRASSSRDHDVRRTLSKPRLNEPIAQNPVTITPSASPTRKERSNTCELLGDLRLDALAVRAAVVLRDLCLQPCDRLLRRTCREFP